MKTKTFLTICLLSAAGLTLARAESIAPASVADIKLLAKHGMSEEVILSHIRHSHASYRLSTVEIIELKEAGVTQKIIDFMINTASLTPPPAPAPVVIEEVREVTTAPAPMVEIVPVAPGPDYVWVSGYWTWRRTAYGYNHCEWVPGVWAHRPHRDAVWIGARWEPHHGVNVWVDGHWR